MNVENQIIGDLIGAMLTIVPLGAAVRILFCAAAMVGDDEKRGENKRRIKNVLVFTVFAEVAVSVINLVYHYYG